jgi:hypothetical protein
MLVILSTLLPACQSGNSLLVATPNSPIALGLRSVTAKPALPKPGTDCRGFNASFRQNGGKIDLPELPDDTHYGSVRYASGNFGDGLAEFTGCPGFDNSFNVPVPSGFSPDWFGQLRFTFAASFGQADLYGKMFAPDWLPRTDYFMYLYDGDYNFIESYKIGRANVKKAELKFPSPFENGLATPADGTLYLEIVHSSK